jgi:hypothetical protein
MPARAPKMSFFFGADAGSAHLEHIHKIKFGAGSFLPLGKKPKSLRMLQRGLFTSHEINLWICSKSLPRALRAEQ